MRKANLEQTAQYFERLVKTALPHLQHFFLRRKLGHIELLKN